MNINFKFLSVALATVALGTASVLANTAPAAGTNSSDAMTALFGDPVIAKGTGFEIKRSSLDQVVTGAKAQYASSGREVPPDLDLGLLNQLISIQLLLQTATDADKAAGVKESATQYTNLVKRLGSVEALQRQLKVVGMTEAEMRAKATQEATARAALERALNVTVSDDEVKKFYTDRPADFEQPEQVHVRHLLLMTMDPTTQAPLSADQVAAKRKQIEDLLKRARSGEDFAALAKQYTEDPGSKEAGGEYTFPRGKMVPEFEAAAFSLTNGQVSDVVVTKYGFHIIKLLDRVPAQTVPLAKVAEDIKNYLVQQKLGKLAPAYLAKLKKDENVEIVDPALKSKMEAAEAAEAAAAAAQPGMGAPAGGSNP